VASYELTAADFTQLAPGAVLGILSRWTQTLATTEAPRLRLLLRALPVNLRAPIHRARRAEAEADDARRARYIRAYASHLIRTVSDHTFAVEHYMVLPGATGQEADYHLHALASGLGIHARRLDGHPALLPTRYREGFSNLIPRSGNHPLLSVLTSYDLSGNWDWRVLAPVLHAGYPVTLAIEMHNYTGPQAMALLSRQQAQLEGLRTNIGAKPALMKRAADFETLLGYVQQGEAVHLVSIAALVQGENEEELLSRESQIGGLTSGYVQLTRYDGMQADLFRTFFTDTQQAPDKQFQRNVTSSGAAVMLGPLGLSQMGDTHGIFWGRSQRGVFFWDGFGPQLNQPNHWVWLGTTGSGKTGSSSALLLREMNLAGTQVIMLDPMGNCLSLVEELGERASFNPLSLDTLRMNPVERIYDNDAQQGAHLQVILHLLLGRELTELENVAVDLSLVRLYDGITSQTPAANQPTLEILSRVLQYGLASSPMVEAAARQLGALLYERFVRGSMSTVFNVATESDWRLERDLVAFDFRGVPAEANLRRLAYYLVLSTLERWALDHKRERRRIVWIDEFARLSGEPMLARQVATMFKTFRTLGVGVWALEQDLVTFVGLEDVGGSSQIDISAGLQILSNASGVVALAHLAAGAQVLPQRFPQMLDDHVSFLTSLRPKEHAEDRGRGLLLMGDQVHPLHITLTPYELQVLGGS
jgi:hypothetical protein